MQTMALIIVALSAIKIIVLLTKPKAWVSVFKAVYRKPSVTTIVFLVLSVIVLNYLLKEITIVQIFAVMLFFALLTGLTVASAYSKDVVQMATKLLKDKNMIKKAWLAILIWTVLIIWALKELFM